MNNLKDILNQNQETEEEKQQKKEQVEYDEEGKPIKKKRPLTKEE